MMTKVTNSRKSTKLSPFWDPFILFGICFIVSIYLFTGYYPFEDGDFFWRSAWTFLILGFFIIYFFYRSLGLAMDLMITCSIIWWIYSPIGYKSAALVFLPMVTTFWILISHKMVTRFSIYLAWSGIFLGYMLTYKLPLSQFQTVHYLILGTCFSMLSIYTLMNYRRPQKSIRKIDMLLCSYSGNTAHFSSLFAGGAMEYGTEIVWHRFHYYKDFQSQFNGDALVISFPIFGCKPPWPLLYYLTFKLPRGHGKPAGILYTCIGGAENAGILVWLILTMKGYRVIGRNMAVYPLNVPTFRLGPKKLWKFFDSLLPRKVDIDLQIEAGRQFASGHFSGIPFIFGLTPAFLVGILLDNKLLDTFLYRNHVMKKRCNQCGICIDYCPANRLEMEEDYPKAKGTCTLCCGCVNLCPKQAMHLWGWTEYGQPYKPKYRKYVIKNEKNIPLDDSKYISKNPDN